MIRIARPVLLTVSHVFAIAAGFGLGIYLLPILTAPEGPAPDLIRASAASAMFTGEFSRDLEDSDAFHWGEGTLFVSDTRIVFDGRISPGPDYRLYLSPQFVETEAQFEELRSQMVQAGHVRTFEGFVVDIPELIDPADFDSAIVWCESFGQFITAAYYR